MPSESTPLFALLVGINEYASKDIRPLTGCVNDIAAMEKLLEDAYQVPPENLRKLIDSQATHAAIVQAFRDHLIGNAQKLGKGTKAAFLFHFCGHGSQAPSLRPEEPDGLDETLVPHDSRAPGVYDIKDWELGALIDELTEYTENVTIILDSCHSGSGTRKLDASPLRVRQCPPDKRPQILGFYRPDRLGNPPVPPAPTPAPPVPPPTPPQPAVPPTPVPQNLGPSGWLKSGQYVLLAACRDDELAREHDVREGQTQSYGLLTYHVVQELSRPRVAASPLTYRLLHERVKQKVEAWCGDQNVQCEGDRDRAIFGDIRPPRDNYLTVSRNQNGELIVNGGAAHGLTAGTLLTLYDGNTQTRPSDPTANVVGTLEVLDVGAVESVCKPQGNVAGSLVGSHAFLDRVNLGDMQARVVLKVDDRDLEKALGGRLGEKDVASFVEVVSPESSGEFRVVAVGNELHIQDAGGKLLVAPSGRTDLDGVARDLSHLVRFRNGLRLENRSTDPALAGAVRLEIKKLGFDPENNDPRAEPLDTSATGETVIEVGQRVVFEVTNLSTQPLHVYLFDYASDWEIALIYPTVAGAQSALAPGKKIQIGCSTLRKDQVEANLPQGMNEGRDVFKVLATVKPTEASILCQGPLKTPYRGGRRKDAGVPSELERLLEQSMTGGRQRAYGQPQAYARDEWTTTQVEVLTVRSAAAAGQPLAGGRTVTFPDHLLEVTAPPGFTGRVRVLSARQVARSVGGDPTYLRPPAGLARYPDLFRPVDLRPTRAADPAGALLEIEPEPGSREQVTEKTPLTVRLKGNETQDTQGLMMLAYDGSLFYPVGRGTKDTATVTWLPEPDGEEEVPLRSQRSAGRLVRLYLYQLADWKDPTLGLHAVRFVPTERSSEPPRNAAGVEYNWKTEGGEVRYWEPRAEEFRAGQRVALYVHGFSSDTRWEIAGISRLLLERGSKYDHVLTFNYESFNTTIRSSGESLTRALMALGFARGDQITLDIFCHSMGTQVVRVMVELCGGEEFVDRVFMAGPPNQGTRLAEGVHWTAWLTSVAINNACSGTAATIVGWILDRVREDGVGVKDLRPGAKVYEELNDPNKRLKVPYWILAGNNEAVAPKRGFWKKLGHKLAVAGKAVVDRFYGNENDLIVGVDSMRGIPKAKWPPDGVPVVLLPCNHFEYFDSAQGQEQLMTWLGAGWQGTNVITPEQTTLASGPASPPGQGPAARRRNQGLRATTAATPFPDGKWGR